MSEIILSICIPTYNRAKYIYRTLNHISSFPSEEIEVVVSDNASSDDTEALVKKIKDSRIKYYRNEKNLGFDINLLKCIEKAKGDFVFFLSDEDFIELKTIPWIIEIIKINDNLTQILGSILNKRQEKTMMYFNPGNEQLKAGYESLIKYFCNHPYLSGIILKKSSLNLKHAKKYNGMAYMHLVLMAQAMVVGNTSCTTKVLCTMGEPDSRIYTCEDGTISAIQGKKYDDPISRLVFYAFRLLLIKEISKRNLTVKKGLMKIEIQWVCRYLISIFYNSFYDFCKILPEYLVTLEYIKRLTFWANFLKLFVWKIIFPIYDKYRAIIKKNIQKLK